MTRKITVPRKGKRQKVTLMIDSQVYRKVRKVVDQVPAVSVSDLVSELLDAVIEDMAPLIVELLNAKNHTQRVAILERQYAHQSGQLALEFARNYHELLSSIEEDEEP